MMGFTEDSYSFIQVVAAVSYQIVPADTQYAEIPLAVVRSSHQRAVCTLLQSLIKFYLDYLVKFSYI